MFNFDLEVVDAIYNWVSVDEDKRRGKTYRFLMERFIQGFLPKLLLDVQWELIRNVIRQFII